VPFGKSIPGETPIDDISGLKIRGLLTRSELNEVEAQNILKATVKYLAGKPTRTMAPFDLSWALKLHNQMFGDVWTWAGERRQTNLNIGVAWEQIEIALQQLLENLAYQEQQGTDLMEQTVMLHHRAAFIHPFLNGNGRWARMLANIWLKLHGQNIIGWPEETIGVESTIRQEYLEALRKADDWDYDSLMQLHRKLVQPLLPAVIRKRRQQRPLRPHPDMLRPPRTKRRRPPRP